MFVFEIFETFYQIIVGIVPDVVNSLFSLKDDLGVFGDIKTMLGVGSFLICGICLTTIMRNIFVK